MIIGMSEVYDRLKISRLHIKDSSTQGSILQISNYIGYSSFSQSIKCTNVITRPVHCTNGNIDEIVCGRGIFTDPSGSLLITSIETIPTISITDISGMFKTIYVNFSQINNIGYYLYSNNNMLGFQRTIGLSNPSTIPAPDLRINLTAWPQILAQETPLSLPSSSLADLANTVNSLITLFANLGIIVSLPSPPVLTGVLIDASGVTLSWTGSLPSYTVYLDKVPVLTNVVGQSCHLTLLTNIFAYDVSVSGSVSLPVSICTINSNPRDMGNYYPSFGISPTTAAYYRASSPGKVNYIIVIAETSTVSVNTFLIIKGSNATPTTPISLITYFSGVYLASPVRIQDSGPHVLAYNSGSGTWYIIE
jgi:hypothetical protein